MTLVDEWARIVAWCDANAPETSRGFRKGASETDIRAAEEASGVAWTDELRELFAVQNGELGFDPSTQKFLGGLFPTKFMLSLDQVLEVKNLMREVWVGLADDPDIVPEGHQEQMNAADAGTETGMFLDAFVPFVSLDDYHYFIDTRPGRQHGCVTEYAHESGDSGGVQWDSIESMLATIARALEESEPFDVWRATVVDGALEWEIP